MNVLFISPGFPRHFYQFCARLKERGVNVLGIGDSPWEALSDNCRNALCDYRYVPSLTDYDAVLRSTAEFIFLYGKINFVESQNEFWLELDAAHGDDIVSYCQDVPENLRKAGTRLLKVFNTKNRLPLPFQAAWTPRFFCMQRRKL